MKDLFNLFHKSEPFTKCQSVFLPGDSYASQLLSIVHDINFSFNCDPTQDVRDIFLDIFLLDIEHISGYIFWRKELLYKLEIYGVKGEVFNLLGNYLHEHYQRVVLNGQISSLELIKSEVPQGSALGPLMSSIYISDLTDNIQSTIFADDTFLFHMFLINSHNRVS